jgi:hypothetical protein
MCHEKIKYVVENEIRQGPYIAWISKQQMLWGNGVHWGKCEDISTKAGLLRHAGVRRPSDDELLYQLKKWGICIQWPPPALNYLLNSVVRTKLIHPMLKGKGYTDLGFLYGKGYVTKDGKMDQRYSTGISGYFIYLRDDEFRQDQQTWLSEQDLWLRIQFRRCQDTFERAVMGQIESAKNKEKIGLRLLNYREFDELDAAVDQKYLTWNQGKND